jgi:hypothetical protein
VGVPLHLVLDPVPVPSRRVQVARVLGHLFGLALAFTTALVGGGVIFHHARGPHAHVCSPPASCIGRR